VLVYSGAVGYACLVVYFALTKHAAVRTGFDLANFDQALWLLSQGAEPFVTQHGRSYLGDHFGLTPILLTPLYVLGGGAKTLLVVQALTMAAVAPLLFSLARAYGASPWVATLPGLLWLTSPLTLMPNLQDFHHVPFAAPLVVGSLLALKHDRLFVYSVLAALASCAKEDMPLIYVMVGIAVALEGRRRLGAAISAASLALFVFALFVFMPAFTDSGAWFASRFGGDRGDSLSEVARWMLSNPLAALGDLVTQQNVVICAALILTTGGLCLLAPKWLLLGAPALAHNLLSAYPPQHALRDHYYVPVALAFSIAAAVGVHRLLHIAPHIRLLAAAGVTIALFAFPFGVRAVDASTRWPARTQALTGGAEARKSALGLIPDDVAVAASPRLTPHLSHRREVYTVPLPFFGREEFGSDWSQDDMTRRAGRVRLVILDTLDRPLEVADAPERLAPLLPRLGFRRVFQQGTVSVYRR
jgi:uncharacterized membrane protein